MANRSAALVILALPVLLAACSGSSPSAGPPDGPALFKKHCAVCHGADGKDKVNPSVKFDMTSPEWQKSLTDEQITKTIKQGLPAKGMPPFGTMLTDDRVNAIVKDAVRKFGKEGK